MQPKSTDESIKHTFRPKSTYRLKRVEIKRGDAIDQIKFIYSDGKNWSAGHDGGKADNRQVVMTDGEYLVRVTHERFRNYKLAGAAVVFESNLGRIWEYKPARMCTNRASELVTITARPGYEIISMSIEKGILVGSEQQPIETPRDKLASWFVVAQCSQKDDNVETYGHYYTKNKAVEVFNAASSKSMKHGQAVLLLDAMKLKILKQRGSAEAVKVLRQAARANGFYAPKKDEDVNYIDALIMLFRLLNKKNDIWEFVLVIALLAGSSYFDLYASMMTGYVLTMFSEDHSSALDKNWVAGFVHYSFLGNAPSSGSVNNPAEPPEAETKALCISMIIAFLGVKVLQNGLYVANVWIHHNSCDKKNHQMAMGAFNHVLSLDQAFFDTHATSEIRESMKVHSINNLITWNIPYLVCRFLKLALLVYFMGSINVRMTAIACMSLLLIKYGLLDRCEAFETNTHRVQRKLDHLNHQILDETFDMVTSIKLFSRESQHRAEHEQTQRRYMANINTVVMMRCFREFGYGILRTLSFAVVLWQGLDVLSAGKMSAGDITSFFLLFQQFQEVFGSIKWHWSVLVREFPDIERFLSLMQEEPAMLPQGTLKPTLQGSVAFEGVRFEYPSRPGEETLKGLTVKFAPRKMTAIVGDSGAGKSTVTKLLMRLYDPKDGRVLVDGHDLRSIDLQHLHEQVAIVPQNPDLFNCSLGENIAYGMPPGLATHAQIVAAAKLANCYDFIMEFRGGFDTYAGTRGSQLSAGQKQRIAIARAAIRQPKVLILDEATSSLDATNERLVQEALDRVMHGKTVIVIAHRLCTIKNADEIVVMEQGSMVEQGTHTKLMEAKGVYHRLVSKQLLGRDSGEGEGEGGSGSESGDSDVTHPAGTSEDGTSDDGDHASMDDDAE